MVKAVADATLIENPKVTSSVKWVEQAEDEMMIDGGCHQALI